MHERIIGLIESGGPLPFERFMTEALYGEGGFFVAQTLRSQKGGDFLTSPEISPLFGATIAAWVVDVAANTGEPIDIVEVGSGSGSLLRPLLVAVEEAGVSVATVWAVEVSPAARRALVADDRLSGRVRVVSGLGELPESLCGVVVANELLDNLPMAIAQLTPSGWRERWVGVDGDRLCFVDAPARPEVLEWLDRHSGPVDVEGWVEVQLEAQRWLLAMSRRLDRGAMLLIDYGDTAENLAPRRRDGTLRTYRAHHLGPHPLDEPGATDITADVNFSALLATASSLGLGARLHRQDEFLSVWGLRAAVSDRRHRELDLARAGDETARLVVRSERSEMETLLHPRGLGDFRVLEVTVPADHRSRTGSHRAGPGGR